MDKNLERFLSKIEVNGFINRYRNFPRNKLERLLIKINEKFHRWLICGFRYVKDKHAPDGRTYNMDYNLFTKLCKYRTPDEVKITLWDKIRFKIVTGHKFE